MGSRQPHDPGPRLGILNSGDVQRNTGSGFVIHATDDILTKGFETLSRTTRLDPGYRDLRLITALCWRASPFLVAIVHKRCDVTFLFHVRREALGPPSYLLL